MLVYGDTNSTLAGALAASKLHIPVVHVEAGLRSYNKRMPEEQNRIVTDHLSTLLLCPTNQAVLNLSREGLTDGVQWVGDVMYDAARFYADRASAPATVASSEPYYLVTVHRAENTDDPVRLKSIVAALNSVPERNAIFPMHPRTRKVMTNLGLSLDDHLRVIDPVGYYEMIWLEQHADFILTDSGGVQKEAYFYRKPCGTLRDETEWVETVEAGANTLLGADYDRIRGFLLDPPRPSRWDSLYGSGDAGGRVVDAIVELLQ